MLQTSTAKNTAIKKRKRFSKMILSKFSMKGKKNRSTKLEMEDFKQVKYAFRDDDEKLETPPNFSSNLEISACKPVGVSFEKPTKQKSNVTLDLPKLINTISAGETSDEEIFSDHCKLYRFSDSKEWKEIGMGDISILSNSVSGKSIIKMRRENVLTLACNHFVASQMKMTKNGKCSLIWNAMDLENAYCKEPTKQLFCVRFKEESIASRFSELFEDAVAKCESFLGHQFCPKENKLSMTAVAATKLGLPQNITHNCSVSPV